MPERPSVVCLSHPLGEATPTWRDNPQVTVEPYTRIADGDVANQSIVRTLNHNGTHLDAPLHFTEGGRSVTDFDAHEWFFAAPVVIDVPKGDDELIDAPDLAARRDALDGADLLLIRTGFGRHRGDAARYGQHAPGFTEAAGRFLLELADLRAVGMDIPSAAAPQALEEGVRFHQVVLDTNGTAGRTLVLIEDMRLPESLETEAMREVIVAPLLLEGLDGAPATIFAVCDGDDRGRQLKTLQGGGRSD